jgi:hypothetical protein
MALTKTTYRMTSGAVANVLDYSHLVTGTDWRAAIQAAFDSGPGEVWLPQGIYPVSSTLNIPIGVSLCMEEGAIIRATAAMAAIVQTPVNQVYENCLITGGTYDCNGLADCGIWLRLFAYIRVTDLQIRENKVDAIRLGATTASISSYEAILQNIRIIRSLVTAPVGSSGIKIDKCGDSHFSDIVIMGQKTGVSGSLSDSKITRVHCWNALENGNLNIGFSMVGFDTILSQCQVDGPLLSSGYYIAGLGNHLIGCAVNYTPPSYGGVDLQAVGVFVETGANAVVTGCNFKAQSASARLAADISGSLVNARLSGNTSVNCATVVSDRSKTAVRAWVTINGLGSPNIRASYNVSSVTDLGVGNYQVNLTRDMLNTDFCVQVTGRTDGLPTNGIVGYEYARTNFSASILTYDPITASAAESSYCNVLFMGT